MSLWFNPYIYSQTSSDPYYSFVTLLLHFNNNATDNSLYNAPMTLIGSPVYSSSVYKFGAYSANVSPSGKRFDTPTSASRYRLGTRDFTIEFWFYGSSTGTQRLMGNMAPGYSWSFNTTWVIGCYNGAIGFENPTNGVIAGAARPFNGAWHHFAVVRSGTTIKTYVDGVQDAQNTGGGFNIDQNATSTQLSAGGSGNGTGAGETFNGYLDDVRVTIGYARYTANFSPPSAAFPNSGPLFKFTTDPSVTSSSVTNSSLTITWVLNSGTTPSGTTYTISTTPSSGVTIGTPTLSGGITSVNITTMTGGTAYTIYISAACTGYTSISTALTQFVGVAPTANLDIQLSFGSATLPSYTDNSLTQAITYKFRNSGGQQSTLNANDISNFAMYNDATRGYVLAANAQNLAQASNPYLGNYALLGTSIGTNNYHMPLNHTVMLWFYLASLPTNNAPHLLSCGSQIGFTHYIYFPLSPSQLTFFTNGAIYTANPPIGYGGTWVGKWTHIARTYNGSTMLVYVNGSLVNGAGNNGNGTADTSNDVNIAGFIDGGNYSTGNNNCLNGYLDNIRIYSSVLSAAQISNIYTYENSNPTS